MSLTRQKTKSPSREDRPTSQVAPAPTSHGNEAAKDVLASRESNTVTNLSPNNVVEIHPDVERLVAFAGGMYGGLTRHHASPLANTYATFDATGAGRIIRGAASNGHFMSQPYLDTGWLDAHGLMMSLQGISGEADRAIGTAKVRFEITAKATNLHPVGTALGTGSTGVTAGTQTSRVEGSTLGASASAHGVGVQGGVNESATWGSSTGGSAGLSMAHQMNSLAADLVFEVRTEVKPLIGAAMSDVGSVRAGTVLLQSAMLSASASQP